MMKQRNILAALCLLLLALAPGDGRVLWEFPWAPRIDASVSAATPLVIGETVFISASYGAGALLVVGEKLLILTERGELIAAPASPQKFSPTARAQILGTDIRAHPALAHGRFYARDKGMLIGVDLQGHP